MCASVCEILSTSEMSFHANPSRLDATPTTSVVDSTMKMHARVIKSVDYQRIACDQLKYVLMKRKLRLSQLCIGYESNITEYSTLECFETLFSSIGRMVMPGNVKIKVCGPAITVNMLSILDPLTLSCIELKCFKRPDGTKYGYEIWSTEKINQLTSLVQRKHAPKLIAKDPFDFCEPSHFTHFKKIDIIIDFINRESLIKLKSMFSDPRSCLASCSVRTESKFDTKVLSSRNGFVLQRHWSFAGDVTLHYAFPNVDEYYLAFHSYPKHDDITIRKLRR
ncbi:hypothetical protein CRE_30197 [Caenorhabditis remanei]|uniref:Uncharacterized protein n=1 Tax=Caenorhabditis remanei TaxID=31234 RepID=E3NGM8_CAERE|nr:hypothetical protein CRE_30197 [Caenorhabditis remanei]